MNIHLCRKRSGKEEVAAMEQTIARTSVEGAMKGSSSSQVSSDAVPADSDQATQSAADSSTGDARAELASGDDTSTSKVVETATTGVTLLSTRCSRLLDQCSCHPLQSLVALDKKKS